MSCAAVGATNPDISGLGIILAFAIQGFISMALSIWSFCLRDVWEKAEATDEITKQRYRKIRRRLDTLVVSISDVQIMTGIALLLSGLVQRNTLDLYHSRIIYDTVNFTAVSFCAAIMCSFAHEDERRLSRYLGILLFSGLYLGFVIVFGIHLAQWDEETPGSCYEFTGPHPLTDEIYLSLTCVYMYVMVIACILWCPDDVPGERRRFRPTSRIYRFGIMIVSVPLFPMHLYHLFALRARNQDLLTGDSENSWGFGQTVAVVMVGQVVVQCCREFRDYYKESNEAGGDAVPIRDLEGADIELDRLERLAFL